MMKGAGLCVMSSIMQLAPERLRGPIFPSPDFERYVERVGRNEAAVFRMADRTELWRIPALGDANGLQAAFDPRGRWLAVRTEAAGVRVFAAAEHRELQQWPGARLMGASTDGALLFLEAPSRWTMVRTADWTEAGNWPRAAGKLIPRVFDPTPGRTFLAGSWGRNIEVLDWSTRATVTQLQPLGTPAVFSWHGDRLVVGSSEGPLQVFDLRRQRSTMLGRQALVPACHFMNAEGSLLLTSSYNAVTNLWHPASGESLAQARGLIVEALCTDGRRFTTGGSEPRLGAIQHSAGVRFLSDRLLRPTSSAAQASLDVSPDGRLLALCDPQRLALYELATGRLLATRAAPHTTYAVFTPDGLGLWAIHFHSTRFQQIHGEMHFLCRFIGVVARRAVFVCR